MGGRRFHAHRQGPAGNRPRVERQPSTPKTKPAEHSHTHSHGGNSIQRVVRLQSLLGNAAVSKLLEKKPDPESSPAARETLMQVSRASFERVIDRLPGLLGPASRLLATPMTPGQAPGDVSAVPELAGSLLGLLAELDGAIHQFEKAGGELTEIQPIVAIRAQISTALFFLQQIQAGAPFGAQLFQCVQEAILEGIKYRTELAIKKALAGSGTEQEGPRTADRQRQIDATVLRWRALFLGPPGVSPSASALKSA